MKRFIFDIVYEKIQHLKWYVKKRPVGGKWAGPRVPGPTSAAGVPRLGMPACLCIKCSKAKGFFSHTSLVHIIFLFSRMKSTCN